MKKIIAVFLVMSALAVSSATSVADEGKSFAAQEKYTLEKETVYRVKADGKRVEIEDANVTMVGTNGGADGTIFWFIVDPNVNEAMEGSESGIYFFGDEDNLLFFMPYEDADMLNGIYFNENCKQMVLEAGTWVVQSYFLYDFKKTEKKASFRGTTGPIWIDPHRFAFTMVEPDVEPRPSGTDFDGGTSVVVYDTAVEETVPVMKATETINYELTDVDRNNYELQITETSVKTKEDWADPKKHQEKKLTAPFPAAG
ncbi:MAG: hypothetical protein FWG97_01875 [Deltaproteobacteria bacterium]|nr:hypothetical protein [Deltaproteobacteria bacterium]